jgi:glycine cleavage system H protein
MPIAGEVTQVNEDLRGDPSLANKDPAGKGWFFRIKVQDRAEYDALLDEAAYAKLVKEST